MKKTRLDELVAHAEEVRERLSANDDAADSEDQALNINVVIEVVTNLTEIVAGIYLSQAKANRGLAAALNTANEAISSLKEQVEELKQYAAHPLYQWAVENESELVIGNDEAEDEEGDDGADESDQ